MIPHAVPFQVVAIRMLLCTERTGARDTCVVGGDPNQCWGWSGGVFPWAAETTCFHHAVSKAMRKPSEVWALVASELCKERGVPPVVLHSVE